MRVLIDTNILLRSVQPGHPHSAPARQAVATLIRAGDLVFFCPQNMAEFWNVATRPVEKNGLGFSHEETMREIVSVERLLTLLPDIPPIYPAWKALVEEHKVQGAKVYDARLVAVMKIHAVDGILTFNDADFKRYSGITVLRP